MKIGNDIDEKIFYTNGYLDSVMLNENQLNKFLKKLNLLKLEDFELLLDYNRYSYDRTDLIELLKDRVVKYIKNKRKTEIINQYDGFIVDDLIDNLEIFNAKELYFLHNLFAEAEYFTSDSYMTNSYPEIHNYYMSSLFKIYNELSNRSSKRKSLKKI